MTRKHIALERSSTKEQDDEDYIQSLELPDIVAAEDAEKKKEDMVNKAKTVGGVDRKTLAHVTKEAERLSEIAVKVRADTIQARDEERRQMDAESLSKLLSKKFYSFVTRFRFQRMRLVRFLYHLQCTDNWSANRQEVIMGSDLMATVHDTNITESEATRFNRIRSASYPTLILT